MNGLTYDVGNQKVLANLDIFGGIQCLTFYQDNFLTEEKPGVWVNKQYTQARNLEISIEVDGKIFNLSSPDHEVSIDLIADSIPRIIHHYDDFIVYCLPFCPIVDKYRYSMLVYQIYVETINDQPIEVGIAKIPLYQEKYSDQQSVLIYQKQPEHQVLFTGFASFTIGFIDPNAYQEAGFFQSMDTDNWLVSTVTYYQELYGKLKLSDPYFVHLFNRALYQSFTSFNMNADGKIVGSNWGSYPATNRIWNKDMYYSALPFILFEPNLCQQTILWFDRYGVKFPGTKFDGGINHSLSNSLSSLLMSTLYYEYTNDLQFFKKHPYVLENGQHIVDTLLSQREAGDPMLFHSMWISDAFALGNYHTGSNICMWKACEGLSKLFQGLSADILAKRYQAIALEIKKAIIENMTTEGPFGEQFLEGIGDVEKSFYDVENYNKPILDQGLIFLNKVIKNGKIDLLMHDGEESDTTLIPLYGFLDKKDRLYTQTLRFAASTENPTYSNEIRGITWGMESGATFPGFITVLASALNDSKVFEQRMNDLVQLADFDGSWWWWPYKIGSKYGEVVRDFGCGKCGWASGIFVTIFVSQYLGLSLDQGILTIAPIDGVVYAWEALRLGNAIIDVICTEHQITVINRKNDDQKVRFWVNPKSRSNDTAQSSTIDVLLKSQQGYSVERKEI